MQINHLRSRFQEVRLARSIRALYGSASLQEAWKKVVRPGAVVGLKVNGLAGRGISKGVVLVEAICELLRVPVLVGVGTAFDILSGGKRRAPQWMREHGLEWLFRFLQEPRRPWYRYLVYGSQFLFFLALELSGIKKVD